jgi:pimeloyl-ACP methyl ester carboxylesterase
MDERMRLHVEVRGEGDPVVLLHSGGMSGRQWRKLGDRLAPAYRVLLPDFLGSGENPLWPGETPFEYGMDVDAIGDVIAELGRPVHLVGHSYGGLVALTLARTRPSEVRSLAVYDPVAFGVLHDAADEGGLADLARPAANGAFVDDTTGGDEAWFEAFVDYWNGPGSWRALPPASRSAFLRVGRKVYLEVRSLLADRTPRAAYAAVTAPTLLLGGERSPLAARQVVSLLATAIPRATARFVEGAGHMGPISHAGAVNEAIAAHIAAS